MLRQMMLRAYCGLFCLLGLLFPALAETAYGGCSAEGGWLDRLCFRFDRAWNEGQSELMLPLYIWHDPGTYTAEKLAQLNAHPWGGGYMRYRRTESGDSERIYMAVFSDSHASLEPIVGYVYLWETPVWHGFNAGAGINLALTTRVDVFDSIPFPATLPMAGVRYGRFALYANVIPKFNDKLNNGNVGMLMGTYAF